MTRAAIYARVSTDEQAERQTVQNQLDACRAYCERQGYEVVSEHLHEGVSGVTPFHERNGGSQLLNAADAGDLDCVVAYRLDRFGRDALVCLLAIERLRPRVGLEYVNETFEASPFGNYTLTNIADIAQFARASGCAGLWGRA